MDAVIAALEGRLLTTVISLPAVSAIVLALVAYLFDVVGLKNLPASIWRSVGFGASLTTFFAMAYLSLIVFDPERLGLQVVEVFEWSAALGANFSFALDGVAICFLVSTTGLVPLAMMSARGAVDGSARAWVLMMLALETTLLGAIAAANLLTFVAFWATTLVPILLWMGRWGGLGRARAASRIWATEAIGLAGLLFVVFVLHETTLTQFGAPTLDLVPTALTGTGGRTLLDVRIELADQWPLFLAFAVGLATRLPIVPLHFWLPGAHAAAPTGLSVLIATGFVQTAAMGWLRFALPLFPDAATAAGPALSLLGIVALAYASLIALVQKELKRLVAYASVGYAGFALFGISTLNVQGLTGAVIQLLTHGLATAGLFLLIGFLAVRRGTTEVAAFGGLAKPMPVCAFFFAVMVLSLMGLPLLGGFVGDLFVLLGSLETRRGLSVLALIVMVVAASYLLLSLIHI